MAITKSNKLDIVFKKLFGKTHSGANLGISNESTGSFVQLNTKTVFGETINSPPGTSTLWAIDGAVQYVELDVEVIPNETVYIASSTGNSINDSGDNDPVGSANNLPYNHGYRLKLPSNYQTNTTNVAGPTPFTKFGTNPFVNNFRLANSSGSLQVVPPSFHPNYSAKVYSGATLLGEQDATDYYLDYYSGILFVQDYDATKVPTKVQAYIYVGKYANEAIVSTGINNVSASTVNQVAFYNTATTVSGGTNLYWNNGNSRLGINTSSPNTAIEVLEGDGPQIRLLSSNSSVDTRITSLGLTANAGIVGTYSNHPLVLQANNTEAVRITSGKVGIGTADPKEKLHLIGNAILGDTIDFNNGYPTSDLIIHAGDATNTLGQSNAISIFRQQTGVSWPQIATLSLGRYEAGTTDPRTRLDFSLKHIGNTTDTAEVTVMTLNSNSNVGIGTTDPKTKLDVNGAAQLKSYNLGGNDASATWYKVGTFATTQNGCTLKVSAYIHAGYDSGLNSYDFYTEIYFKTSNGSTGVGTFAGNSWYSTFGNNSWNPTPKWVANGTGATATSFDLYLYLPIYTLNSYYKVDISDVAASRWTHLNTTSTDPGVASATICVSSIGHNITNSNVGIGTTNPGAKLDVFGNQRFSAGSPEIEFNTGGPRIVGNVNGTANTLTFHTAGGLGSTSNEAMRINSSGYVGIGTSTTNSYRLTALGPSVGTATGTVALTVPGGALSQRSSVSFYSTFGGGTTDYVPRRTADIVAGFNAGVWGTEYLSFNVGGAADDQFLTSEKMRITSGGTIAIQPASNVNNASPGIVGALNDNFAYNSKYLNHYGLGFHVPVSAAGMGAYLSGYYGIDLFTGGINRLSIPLGGNVGIGTTNPSTKLNIYSTDDTRGLRITNTLASSYSEIQLAASAREYRIGVGGNTASTAGTPNNLYVFDSTAGALRMLINSSGYVGIGTTNPSSNLHIAESALPKITIQTSIGGAIGTGSIEYSSSFAGVRSRINFDFLNRYYAFNYDNVDKYRIYSAGSVDMGSVRPAGDASDTTLYINNVNGAPEIFLDSNATTGRSEISFAATGSTAWTLRKESQNSGASLDLYDFKGLRYAFRAYGNGTFALMPSAGNVGIGTTNALTKLHVVGNSYPAIRIQDTLSTGGASLEFVNSAGTVQGSIYYDFLSNYITINGNGGEDFRITSTGLVGIGTANPGAQLDVYGAAANIRVGSSSDAAHGVIVTPEGTTEKAYLYTSGGNTNHAGYLRLTNGDANTTIANITMRNAALTTVNLISNSGNTYFNGGLVGIGTSTPQSRLHVYATATEIARFENNGTNDAFISVRESSTEVVVLGSLNGNGFVGTSTNNLFALRNFNINRAYVSANGLVPWGSNTYSCGTSGELWSAVYVQGGVLNGSDERIKKDIENSDLGLEFINQLRPVKYRLKNRQNVVSIDENGNEIITPTPGVRFHYGLIAQEVKDALGDRDFAGYAHDPQTDWYGLRYEQFISPLIKAAQELSSENKQLKSKLEEKDAQIASILERLAALENR